MKPASRITIIRSPRVCQIRAYGGSLPPKTDLEVAPATTKQKATHLLLHNQAHPLSAQRFAKHLDPQHSKTRSTDIAVNGVIAPGETVYVGDRVLLQELTYTAITVL